MSTPRGGRGAERGRGTSSRGGSTPYRGAAGRGRGNGASTSHTGERPTQQVYTPGARGGRGGSRGAATGTAARGGNTMRGTPNARGSFRGANTSTNTNTTSAHGTFGGPNSTPHDAGDYAKRLEYIRGQRPELRAKFIREGRMNPEGQMRLSDSVSLVGICTDMCPEFERVRRIVEDDVKAPECTPETEHLPRKQRIPDETRMVKAYARSAAGMDVELVSEIRSPRTCLETLDYLMQRLDHDDFDFLHGWIWDRTRAIRKDLRTQSIKSRTDINVYLQCLERSARFLLLSTHQMARSTREDYSHQQDIEQLNATLMSLRERYVDNRRINEISDHEAEFYAYRLILAPIYTSTQLENELHGLPLDLRNNPRIQTAIEIFRVLKAIIFHKSQYFVQVQANWKRFWELCKSPSVSYLMACAAEVSFQRVRHVVLDTLWRVYRIGTATKPKTVDSWTTNKLKDVLGLDSDSEAVNLCEQFGFEFSVNGAGQTFLDICKKGYARTPLGKPDELKPQTFSQRIVEQKRHNRVLSSIVQGQSVHEAENSGLTTTPDLDSEQTMDDETSLFVPETSVTSSNIFAKANGSAGGSSAKLSAAANPFMPKSFTESNPFIKGQTSSLQPSAPKPTSTDMFDAVTTSTSSATTKATSSPFANPFLPAKTTTPLFPPSTSNNVDSPFTPNPFVEAAKFKHQPAPTTTTPSASPTPFAFPSLPMGEDGTSFTPIGTPTQPASSADAEEKRKTEQREQRRRAEAAAEAAEAQRKRAEMEKLQQAQEAAERQRREAEQHRLRLQQQEQERLAQEARNRQAREEEAKLARIRTREAAWDSLTADLMFDKEDGLMLQFVENAVLNTVQVVIKERQEVKRQQIWKEKATLAETMYIQRQLGLKRLVMASWIAKVEKKKRARHARDRRKRLKEQRARRMNEEEMALQSTAPAVQQQNGASTFRRPEVPASARRAKRTEQRRGAQMQQQISVLDSKTGPSGPNSRSAAHAALTPVSMSNSLTSNGDYSEAYKKSTAPIDRTETDWFELRAMGIDPSKHRKRSFDSASDDDEKQELEVKRPKISPSATVHAESGTITATPVATTTDEQLARFRALQQSFRRSGASPPQPNQNAVLANSLSSSIGRSTSLIEKARQLLGASAAARSSSTDVKHDWGRSIPHLGISASMGHRSVQSMDNATTSRNDRAAYWTRKSRFVPQHLYGRGPEAIHAYRQQYGLNSPTSTRPTSIEPIAVSSPVPAQLSYKISDPTSQEQYSEDDTNESSGVEVIDVDANDDQVGATEEEYEDEEYDEDEDEEEEQEEEEEEEDGGQYHQPSHRYQPCEEEEESADEAGDRSESYANGMFPQAMAPGFHAYTENSSFQQSTEDGHVYGETEELLEYEEYTDDEMEEDEEEDDEDEEEEEDDTQGQVFQGQHFRPLHVTQHASKQPPTGSYSSQQMKPGATEDDAIELSD